MIFVIQTASKAKTLKSNFSITSHFIEILQHGSYAQGKFIPIHFAKQILPGTFEYSLNHLIDHELDLSRFDERFKTSQTDWDKADVTIPSEDFGAHPRMGS